MLNEIKDKVNIKQILIICFIVLILFLIVIIGILNAQIQTLKQSTIQLPDTTTNTAQIDKLKDSIKVKEKEIIKYKTEYIYEKEQAKALNDSSALQLFFELVRE